MSNNVVVPFAKDRIRVRDQRVPGWYWAQNEFIDQLAKRVSVYGIAVYHVLARHSRNDEVSGLSAEQIAVLAGCSRAQVFRALKALEKHRAIVRHPSHGNETNYVLSDLKPIKNPQPVSDRDRHRTPGESPTETAVVSDGDGTRLRQRLPYKEARLQDCKTVLPPTPLTGGESFFRHRNLDENAWDLVLMELKTECASTAVATKLANEYDTFFRDCWQVAFEQPNVIVVDAAAPQIACKGIHRYMRRLRAIGHRLFGMELTIQVRSVDEDHRQPRSEKRFWSQGQLGK